MVTIFLRSLVYNVLFYALLVFWILVALPTFVMPPRAFMTVAKAWSRSSVWLLRVICNIRLEVRGLEKIPDGPLIVASKHQSFWETFALLQFFDSPLFIYKRELGWIPFFGWYLMKSKMFNSARPPASRSMPSRITRPASPRSMSTAAWPACRWRSIPACSGRAAPSCAIRERSWWSFSIPCRPDSSAANSSRGSRA